MGPVRRDRVGAQRGTTAPRVYESLEVIHRAQTKSVLLLRRDEPPYGVDVLGISLEKGGASVLADGYLVAGDLTRPQAALFFGLGALLQLADDLQDVDSDARSGTLTVFSQTAGRWPLDRLVNRLFSFREVVLAEFHPGDAPGAAQLGDLMRGASLQLILGAVGAAPRHFTRGYVRKTRDLLAVPVPRVSSASAAGSRGSASRSSASLRRRFRATVS